MPELVRTTWTTTAANTQLVVGTAVSFLVATRGYPAAALTESGTLPAGLTFTNNGDGTASITGTPAAGSGGTYSVTVTAANGLAPNATQTLVFTVLQKAPTATTAVLTGTTSRTATYGPYHFTVAAPGIAVHLLAVGAQADAVPVVTSGTSGYYEFDGVAPGSYQVEFVDPAGKLATQWYNATAAGAADRSGATTVVLTANAVTSGVNATLATHALTAPAPSRHREARWRLGALPVRGVPPTAASARTPTASTGRMGR